MTFPQIILLPLLCSQPSSRGDVSPHVRTFLGLEQTRRIIRHSLYAAALVPRTPIILYAAHLPPVLTCCKSSLIRLTVSPTFRDPDSCAYLLAVFLPYRHPPGPNPSAIVVNLDLLHGSRSVLERYGRRMAMRLVRIKGRQVVLVNTRKDAVELPEKETSARCDRKAAPGHVRWMNCALSPLSTCA